MSESQPSTSPGVPPVQGQPENILISNSSPHQLVGFQSSSQLIGLHLGQPVSDQSLYSFSNVPSLDSRHTAMMYQCQSAVYAASAEFEPRRTDSTPDSAPSFTIVDVDALCALKKRVISELAGKVCPHCSTPFGKVSFVETTDGEIIAYCKRQGSEEDDRGKQYCGRSNVLFMPPTLTQPVYEKFCVFKHEQPAPTVHDIHNPGSSNADVQNNAVPIQGLQQLDLPHAQGQIPMFPHAQGQLSQHGEAALALTGRFMSRPNNIADINSIYQLHGITRPDLQCATCGQPFGQHNHTVDTNGWAKVRELQVALPADWPSLNSRNGSIF
jgi:hypothetical protein